MKYSSILRGSTIAYGLFLVVNATPSMAATLPVAGVDVIVKNTVSGRVLSTFTDAKGNFRIGSNENGMYDIFIGNESLAPVKTQAKNGSVSGRIVILTDATTTTDSQVSQKAICPIPAAQPAKPIKPFIAPLLKQK